MGTGGGGRTRSGEAESSIVPATPEEWEERFSQEHKRPYWVNRRTNQSSWTRPATSLEGPHAIRKGSPIDAGTSRASFGPRSSVRAHSPGGEAVASSSTMASRRFRVAGVASVMLGSGATSKGAAARAQTAQQRRQPLPPGWEERQHEGRVFFAHLATGETTWTHPAALAHAEGAGMEIRNPVHPEPQHRTRARLATSYEVEC